MNEKQAAVSIRPSGFVEGGAVPVDRNLLWKECRFALFNYTKKSGEVVATTCAARITYNDDDGQEFIQHYSAADPDRFVPSEDGKTLVAVGTAQALSKSSNFYVLMNALINAGFPENKLDADISSLDGLYTHNIGIPEPKRSGLARPAVAEGEQAREKVISVPDQILRLPWEKRVAGKPAAAAGKAPAGQAAKAPAATPKTGETEDAAAATVAMVTEMLAAGAESVTRQQLATKAIREKKSAVAKFVFSAEFAATLATKGLAVSGENISVAGQMGQERRVEFKVIAKRYGDSVQFTVEADDTKAALQAAKRSANSIFDYKSGDAGAPTVSVKPVAEE